jgi:LysR family hydrogen peroxide-inducible transcriptional activator
MTLSELKFVVAVAQEKSFRKAAKKIFISQPALSFKRSRKDVSITSVGQKIINQAVIVLSEVEKIKEHTKEQVV